MPDRHIIDVHVLLIADDYLLLTQRRDPNPDFDGHWHLPSGKLDAHESVLDAAAREAEEEIGVLIDPADLHHQTISSTTPPKASTPTEAAPHSAPTAGRTCTHERASSTAGERTRSPRA